jgi:hypothetical protein
MKLNYLEKLNREQAAAVETPKIDPEKIMMTTSAIRMLSRIYTAPVS